MTFDVADLPGRAQELNKAANDAASDTFDPQIGYAPNYVTSDDEVLGIYNDFLDAPAPEDFSWAAEGLLKAMRKLATSGFNANKQGDKPDHPNLEPGNNDLTGVDAAGVEVEDWTGDAADAFFLNYGEKFVPTASNQFCAYYVLRHAVNAEAAVWQTARDDLDKLSKDAIEQMRHVADSNQDDWTNALSVAGAVVAIGGAIPTAGATLSGWAVVGAGVTVASTGMGLAKKEEKKKDPLALANGNPQEIIREVKRALGEIKKEIKSGEEEIKRVVEDAVNTIDGSWKEFCLPRPALADVPRKDIYSPENMGGV